MVDTRSDSKWRLKRQEAKAKEASVDDLINNFPEIWQMQGDNHFCDQWKYPEIITL
jgi:hypothetical protein